MAKPPQQIEQTAKRYKGIMALSVLTIIIGTIRSCGGIDTLDSGPAVPMIIIGFIGYFVARILAWWNHG
jgi:hypothetical protein